MQMKQNCYKINHIIKHEDSKSQNLATNYIMLPLSAICNKSVYIPGRMPAVHRDDDDDDDGDGQSAPLIQ